MQNKTDGGREPSLNQSVTMQKSNDKRKEAKEKAFRTTV
jgi:hypothetical protein